VEVVENGPIRIAIETVRTFGKSKIRQRISLGPTPGIRFDTWVDWHESRKMLKVAFPLNVMAQKATFEIQLGHVERPTHRNTSWDAAKTEVCAQKWADMSETGHGVAILNQGKYGHDVYENLLRLSLLRSPKAPDPECDMGSHFFSYVIFPHFDSVTQSDTVAAAYAFNAEPRVVPVEVGSGVATQTPRFVTCGSRNLVVETVKKSEDAEFLLVRAYECHGSRGTTEISTALPVKNAWLTDLNEVPIGALAVTDNHHVSVDYKPFEIITILIEV
jgi:alpha-mannosidase